ncbi:MAG TPA: hypothetical protein VFB80_24650 [Pirellulaceae bacterium]|nr:hypothetical protein [Pirellulaceae bacterium]
MPDWTCQHCQADVDHGFDVCWQCGATATGERDADFVRERDVATLPADHVRTIQCHVCGYRGKILFARYHFRAWAYVATPLLVLSVFGIVPLVIWLRSTRWMRFKVCPRCATGKDLRDWDGEPTPEDESLWSKAQTRETTDYNRSWFRLLCVILATLLLPFVISQIAWLLGH